MEPTPLFLAPKAVQGQMEALFRRKTRPLKEFRHQKFPTEKVFHVGICVLIVCFYMGLLFTPVFKRFEYIFLDMFFRWRPAIQTSPSIVYVEIAEDSLQGIGRWPWPRQYHAVLSHLLSDWGARAVVFDILFSEASTKFDDGALSEAFQKSNAIYLPVVLEGQHSETQWIHTLPRFSKYARGIGHINITPDSDGTLRRIQPFITDAGETYPHLALKLAYDMQGIDLPPSAAQLPFPKDDDGNILINWAGKWGNVFNHYSFADILKSFESIQKGEKPLISPEVFRNKICFIGLTAFGHADIKATPFEPSYPGLGVHANLLNSILTQQMISPVSVRFNAACLLIAGIIATLIFTFFQTIRVFLFGLAAGFVWVGVSFIIFSRCGIWIDVVHPILLIFTLYVFSVAYAFIMKSREAGVLFSLATRDGLTGLFVIRHFRLLLNAALAEAKAKNFPMSVLLMDVDHFKKVNDTYGHGAGDAVLKEVAKLIGGVRYVTSAKQKAESCRYGGEEFMVLLNNCDLETAVKIGDRLRTTIEEHIFNWEGLRIPVTISIGVAGLHEDESVPDLMVRRADVSLYLAKDQGRNRVVPETAIQTEIKKL